MDGKTGTILRQVGFLALALAVLVGVESSAMAQHCAACGLFGKCAADGGGSAVHCGMPAPSYPVPFATPRPNTQTNFTYPPMMPHNSLQHYAGTYAFRHGPGMSRTTVSWRPTKGLNALDRLHHIFELPR
jgi:hypothetical protein